MGLPGVVWWCNLTDALKADRSTSVEDFDAVCIVLICAFTTFQDAANARCPPADTWALITTAVQRLGLAYTRIYVVLESSDGFWYRYMQKIASLERHAAQFGLALKFLPTSCPSVTATTAVDTCREVLKDR